MKDILTGVGFFLQGIRLILKPELRSFMIVPIFINTLLFIGFIVFLATYFSNYLHTFIQSYPAWLTAILGWLFWFIFWTAGFLITTLSFTILTNVIGSPFYGLLAEKTQLQLYPISLPATTFSFWKILPHTLAREALKLIYFAPWLLLCLVLFIFPPTFPLAPLVWWLVLVWISAIQYIDYTADNQQVSLKEMIKHLKKSPFITLGFGTAVIFAMTIPGANLIVPPAAVVGGTLLWHSLASKK